MHLGHRKVLEAAFGSGYMKAVFTFKTEKYHQKHGQNLEFIYSEKEKERILKNLGAEYIYSVTFSEIHDMTGEEFCQKLLKEKLGASLVSCGYDFRFGKCAKCGADDLVKMGKKYGFDVICVDEVDDSIGRVSSTRIRGLLKEGKIRLANEMLGSEYEIFSEVIHGNHVGNTIGFPTVNQKFEEDQLVPKFGAYISQTKIDGNLYKSITDIGIKPTVQNNGLPLAETYIKDFAGDLYGKEIEVDLLDFIRPERKFNSLDELKENLEYLKSMIK